MNVFESSSKLKFVWRLSKLRWGWRFGSYGAVTRVGNIKLLKGKSVFLGSGNFIDDGVILNAGGSANSQIQLGNDVIIREQAILEAHKGSIQLGNDTFVGQGTYLYGQGGLTIGDHTMIAAGTVIIPSQHNIERSDVPFKAQGETSKGITIGSNVWIGANVTILDGVTLGDNTVVAAGSVVNKSWGEWLIIGGVPAKPIKQYNHKTNNWESYKA